MKRLDNTVSGVVRFFSYHLASGNIDCIEASGTEYYNLLEGHNYLEYLLDDTPSTLEMIYAIFINCLELNEDGSVACSRHAYIRVIQYIREYMDETYEVIPPFESWENELHFEYKQN